MPSLLLIAQRLLFCCNNKVAHFHSDDVLCDKAFCMGHLFHQPSLPLGTLCYRLVTPGSGHCSLGKDAPRSSITIPWCSRGHDRPCSTLSTTLPPTSLTRPATTFRTLLNFIDHENK
ncbi:hypothetical protein CDAR_211771 [Caerostris darwini]|uniref:Secreted protein n=1 Tax=Caerostris darwini TaxID=1538125 RepID=A0AAV4PCG8_9ARAC|nr:hypothetical protein CDAR_211771 [Caerostris darwini]